MDPSGIFRKAALDRLSSPEQYDQIMRVTSPRSWILLVAVLAALALFVAWGFLGRVITRLPVEGRLVSSDDGAMTAKVHVAVAQAQRIRHGMTAHLVPQGLPPLEHGYLIGSVDTSPDAARSASSAAAFTIRLRRAPRSGGGYAWTSPSGVDRALSAGTPVAGSIVVDERRPVEVAIPALKPLFAASPGAP